MYMNLYLVLIALLMGIMSMYTVNKSVRLESKILNSLKKIEKKLKI